MYLSALERKILNCLQEDIPLGSRPFKIISRHINMEEGELLKTIKRLKEKGIIRNFSAHLNHRKLGFRSTLIALRVPLDEVDSVAKEVIKYPEVTHCYLRQGEYNLWLVFICLQEKLLKNFLGCLAKRVGRKNILNLITKKQFKLKTALGL